MFDGYDDVASEMSGTQYAIFACINTLVALLYTVLLMLCLRNIWMILVRLGKWRQPLLSTFYFLSLFSIIFRWIFMLTWRTDGLILVMSFAQATAKFSVGLVQTWMIFELQMKLRQVRSVYECI